MKLKYFLYSIMMLGILATQTACVDQEFDEPPGQTGSNLVPNTTIAELKANYTLGNFEEITDDIIIEGIVISSDESGNFYKEMFIQDATGGIGLSVNVTNLYNEYPLGRRVFVKCQGLTLGDDNGSIQLGGGVTTGSNGDPLLGRIEDVLLTEFVEKGERDQALPISTITMSDIGIADLTNTLVRLDDVQFTTADAGQTYADAVTTFSLNRMLEDCDENQLILRSSGFANFASDLTPSNAGSITGLLSVYRSDFQLFINDVSDISFAQDRCDGSGGGNTGGGGNQGGGDPVDTVNEGFNTTADNADVATEGWYNLAVQGDRLWRGKEFDGNTYAQATAFGDSNPNMEAWLITPPINLYEDKTLSFETAKAFWVHDGLTVWIATDFDGDISTADWEQLDATLAEESDDDHTFMPSGDVDLSDYVGNTVHIAFKYVGDSSSNTTTYRIDNIVVE